jgi:hypothetical protein
MRVCVIFCSASPALNFFKEELFGLCPENSGAPRQLRFSYSSENSEEPTAENRRRPDLGCEVSEWQKVVGGASMKSGQLKPSSE